MLAALLSALMSSLTSIFNSSSTLFTMDLWRQCRPQAQEAELMVVGRMWTLFLAVVSLCWLPILLEVQGSEFWNYSQSIGSYLLPPIVMVFLFGIFWTRTTEKVSSILFLSKRAKRYALRVIIYLIGFNQNKQISK